MAESSCLGGHGTYLVFFRCRNQAINSQNFSDRQTSMMCAHSFSPNSLSNFCCLCFYSSLLCVCIFLICCHSVFVWNPLLRHFSLPDSILHVAVYACLEKACVLARMSWRFSLRFVVVFADVHLHTWYLQRMNQDSHPDVKGGRKEMKCMGEEFQKDGAD